MLQAGDREPDRANGGLRSPRIDGKFIRHKRIGGVTSPEMGSPVLGTWRRRSNRLAALILAIVIGGGAALYWYRGTDGTDPGRTARAPGRPAIPVSVATAARRDVPIYLVGLGAVQPI